MRKIWFIILFLFYGFYSQTLAQNKLLPLYKNGKWAVSDENLNLLTDFQFDDIQIVEGIGFKAKNNGFFGWYDQTLNQILPYRYSEILTDSADFLFPCENGKFGVNRVSGATEISCFYDSLKVLQQGLVILKNNEAPWKMFSKKNGWVKQEFETVKNTEPGVYLLEINQNKILYNEAFGNCSVAFTTIEKKTDGVYFSTDQEGNKFIVNFNRNAGTLKTSRFYFTQFQKNSYVYALDDSLIINVVNSGNKLSIAGESIVPVSNFNRNTISELFSETFYLIKKNGKYGLLNDQFKPILATEFEKIELTGSDLLVVKNGKRGLYGLNGKVILAPLYEEFYEVENAWIISENGKSGWITKSGNVLIKPVYDKIKATLSDKFVVTNGNKKGIADENNRIILPIEFDEIVADSLACVVTRNKKKGLVLLSGEFVLHDKYPDIYKLSNKFYVFTENNKKGIVRIDGLIVANPTYTETFSTPYENIFMVSTREMDEITIKQVKEKFQLEIDVPQADPPLKWFKTGLINSFGEILLNCEYHPEQISFDLTTNQIQVKDSDAVTIISCQPNGKLIEKNRYKNYISVKKANPVIQKNYWHCNNSNLWGLLSPRGNVLIEHQFLSYRRDFLGNPNLVLTTGETNKYGIVDEKKGKVMLPAVYNSIVTSDFNIGKVARCVKTNLSAVLIDSFANIVESGISYIENFNFSHTRVNKGGKIKSGINQKYRLPEFDPEIKDKLIFRFNGPFLKSCEGGKWGIIDNQGEWLVKPFYQFIQTFHQGVYICCKDEKWGAIKPDGTVVINFVYDELSFFPDVNANFWSTIPYFLIKLKDKYGVCDFTGKIIIDCLFDGIDFLKVNGKVYFRTRIDNDKNLFGLLDKSAVEVLPPRYISIGIFKESFAMVEKSINCFNFINDDFRELTPDCYIQARDFNEGMAAIKTKKGWGFIDTNGKIAISPEFIEAGDFCEGLAPVKLKQPDKLFGIKKGRMNYFLINKSGKKVLNTKSEYCSEVSDGRLITGNRKKMTLQTVSGKKILKGKFKKMDFDSETGLLIATDYKNKCTLYSLDGKAITIPGYYKVINEFSEGLSHVESGYHGYIDRNGTLKFTFSCQKAGNFHNGLARVMVKSKWGYIDTSGNLAIKPVFMNAGDFKNGLAMVKNENLENLVIDSSGKIMPFIIEADSSGNFIFIKNGKKGMMDKYGNLLIYPLADQLGFFGEQFAPFSTRKKYSLFDQFGKRLADEKYLEISKSRFETIMLANLTEIFYIKPD
ncbi:MAG: WG repeat-containing protein [Bacteroidales bacterium]